MDEAHLLKDRGSYRSKRLRDVAQQAKQRVMLTGTPLQNDLQVWLCGQANCGLGALCLCGNGVERVMQVFECLVSGEM